MNIKCPHCGTEYEVEREWYGQYTTCESCGKGFVIGTSASKQLGEAASAAADALKIAANSAYERIKNIDWKAQQEQAKTAASSAYGKGKEFWRSLKGACEEWNLPNRQSLTPHDVRVPEYKFFLLWLAYAVVSWLGKIVIGILSGAAIGVVMMANGASARDSVGVCATVGVVVSIAVGYFSFRWLAIPIVRVPEYKYFLLWLAYTVASWLGSAVIGILSGATIGVVMMANEASASAIVGVCATVGAVVSIAVGYFSFRYIVITMFYRWR